VTRLISVLPVIAATIFFGGSERALDSLLVNSQVFLSIALPFSMIPLTIFTSSKKIMGEQWVNKRWVTVSAWVCTIVLTLLNVQIVWTTLTDLF
jgi:manganese transport protein